MIVVRPLLCSWLTLAACVPAAAQTLQPNRPERPYRGIFASGMNDSTHSLTGNATLSGGFDDDILADAVGRNRPVSSRKGTLAQLSGGLNYATNLSRASVGAGVGSSVRYYPSLEKDYFTTYSAGVGAGLRVLDKPEVSVSGGANYQPLTFLSAFPSLGEQLTVEVPEPDFVPVESQYISYNAGISLAHRLSRRVSVSTSGAYRATDRLEREFWSRSASAALRVQMTRDVSLRLGYSLAEGHYEGHPTVLQHRPDIGLDFGRALSLTRRTTISFGVGTDATVANDRTRLRASGHASMTHEIGRSWAARAAYQRGTSFVETIPEPIFSDSAQVSLVGLITRRIQFTSIGSALFGNTGTSSRQFDSYRASAGISVALTRYMNAGVDYAYYKYVFDPLIELPSGIPHDVNRQSIRAHVSFWAPLLNKTRR
jgi:hypothetical protein